MGRYQQAKKVSLHTLTINGLLSLFKLIIGLLSHSRALIADSFHSASDFLSTIVVMLGMSIAKQPPDTKHPYGHGRAETIAAKILAIILIITGFNILYSGFKAIRIGNAVTPSSIAIWGALISIIVKEWMYRYTYRVGKQIQSQALIADAWHHRSDSMSSIASLTGIILARLGWPWVDALAAIVVSLLIIKTGAAIFLTAVDEVMDSQLESEIIETIKTAALSINEITAVKDVFVHSFGTDYHVSLTITADSDMSLSEGHQIVHDVENAIKLKIEKANHISIHIEPN